MTRNGRKAVFIGGSRRISRLPRAVADRLDRIIDQGFTVVVGDANGADKAVQAYVAARQYGQVTVFCMAGHCRNNVGNWGVQEVAAPAKARKDFSYFELKDRAMGRAADYGLMLWDGESRGTLANVEDLARQNKPVVVFVGPQRTFVTVRDESQFAAFAAQIERPHRRIVRLPASTESDARFF